MSCKRITLLVFFLVSLQAFSQKLDTRQSYWFSVTNSWIDHSDLNGTLSSQEFEPLKDQYTSLGIGWSRFSDRIGFGFTSNLYMMRRSGYFNGQPLFNQKAVNTQYFSFEGFLAYEVYQSDEGWSFYPRANFGGGLIRLVQESIWYRYKDGCSNNKSGPPGFCATCCAEFGILSGQEQGGFQKG